MPGRLALWPEYICYVAWNVSAKGCLISGHGDDKGLQAEVRHVPFLLPLANLAEPRFATP